MSYYDLQTSARYIQCPNALREIRRYTHGMGTRFLAVTCCRHVQDYVEKTIKESFASSMESMLMPEILETNFRYQRQIDQAKRFDQEGILPTVQFVNYGGQEITMERVNHLVDIIRRDHIDVIIGVGGGKALDFARAAAYFTGVRVVLVPTMASTNASASPLCVIYNEDGTKQVACYFLPNYQDLVIADTTLLIQAPVKTFVAGIGDQVCTYLEVLYTNQQMNAMNEFPDLCWDVIDKSCDIFMKQSKEAYEAAKRKEINHAYESILHQILYSNGHMRATACSGFAHLLGKVLIQFPPINQNILHGLQVAYAIIPMKVCEGKPLDDIHAYIRWCKSLDIPVSFAQLGIPDVTKEQLLEACRNVCHGPTLELPYTAEKLVDCMLKAEDIVNAME